MARRRSCGDHHAGRTGEGHPRGRQRRRLRLREPGPAVAEGPAGADRAAGGRRRPGRSPSGASRRSGYRPGLEPGVIVPTYPPGLPLAMAAAAGIGGADAVYWVVPVLGAAAVWLTFLLGRRYADAGSGAAAALLVAASPVFLYQLVQPMSDVPVTAWWLLSLWGAAAGRPFAAGLGAAAAVLTRPNLAPLAPLVDRGRPGPCASSIPQASGRAAMPPSCARCPLAAAAGFLAWLNTRLYGSPLASGYGAASELFALANVPVNTGRYLRWLLETQTPFVLLGTRGAVRRHGSGGRQVPARLRPHRPGSASGSPRWCWRATCRTRRSRSGGTSGFSSRPFRCCSILTTSVLVAACVGGAGHRARAAARGRRRAPRVAVRRHGRRAQRLRS